MKPIYPVLMMLVCAAASAHGQMLESPARAPLRSEAPGPLAKLPPASRFHAGSEGLPPADPKAPDLWRADPKLFAGVRLNEHLSVETSVTNPDYREGKRFMGHGPRLAKGVALGEDGVDVNLVGRASVPVDERVELFGTLGVAASTRKWHDGSTTTLGPSASVGGTYKLSNKQTATAEIPLGAMARKRISGAGDGLGASLKLGF